MRKGIPAITLLLLLVMGCATTNPNASKSLLDFLEDGRTLKEEVLLKLGEPSGTFEAERILTYKLGTDKDQAYFLLPRSDWMNVRYSLVLVFDEKNVLYKHSVVKVK